MNITTLFGFSKLLSYCESSTIIRISCYHIVPPEVTQKRYFRTCCAARDRTK